MEKKTKTKKTRHTHTQQNKKQVPRTLLALGCEGKDPGTNDSCLSRFLWLTINKFQPDAYSFS